MDIGAIFTESVAYTKETFAGKWHRWLVFVLCGLPALLIIPMGVVLDMSAILLRMAGTLLLFLVGVILSMFTTGYLARIYRGATPPPEFDDWGTLFIDGLKLWVTIILWTIPAVIVCVVLFLVLFVSFISGTTTNLALLILLTLLAIVAGIFFIIYGPMGTIRCARTGSIREGIRVDAITKTIRSIGWGNYLIALLLLVILEFIYCGILVGIPLVVPVAFPNVNPNHLTLALQAIAVVIHPFLAVFAARYLTHLYDSGIVPQPAV